MSVDPVSIIDVADGDERLTVGLDVTVDDTLRVQIRETLEHLQRVDLQDTVATLDN